MKLQKSMIESKSFTIVGLRYYKGENAFVDSKTGILSVENNNIILKTTNGVIVGSMASSVQKIDELRELGVPKHALTSQKALENNKDIFNNAIVELQQYIPNVCVVVKIVGFKKSNTILRTSEVLKTYIRVDDEIYSISRLNIVVKTSNKRGFKLKDGMTVIDIDEEELSSSKDNKKGDEKMIEIPNNIKEIVEQKVLKNEISLMALDTSINGLNEAFTQGVSEYTMEMATLINKTDGDGISRLLKVLRGLDDLMAKRYLEDKISSGEFDHVRAWITIQGYFFYKYNVEDIEQDEFFTADSISASEKFLKEEEEYSSSFNDEEDKQEKCIVDKRNKCTQCDHCITAGYTECVKGLSYDECDMCGVCKTY